MDEDILELLPPSLPRKALDVPVGMVDEIATGLEEPRHIAMRYGFTSDDWAALSVWEPLQHQVAAKKAEYSLSGRTVKLMSAGMVEAALPAVFLRMTDPNTPFSQQLEGIKILSKLGDLEPRTANLTPTGTGFSININITKPREEINVTTLPAQDIQTVIDVTPTVEVDRIAASNPFVVNADG